MLGMLGDELANFAVRVFSASQFRRNGENDFTPEQAADIGDAFYRALGELPCFYTQQEMNEAVAATMRAALLKKGFPDAAFLTERFIAEMVREPWDLIFDDCRNMRIVEALLRHDEEGMPDAARPQGDDLDVIFMARLFARMPLFPQDYQKYARYGICNAYEAQHMVWWFAGQITRGSGAYSRAVTNFSARKTWSGLRSYNALLWIAIALGVEEQAVKAAFLDMEAAGNLAAKCSAVRRHIPYSSIHALASALRLDRQQAKAWSSAVEHAESVREKLDGERLSRMEADLENELVRTPAFDARDENAIIACFDPVMSYVLLRHGFAEEELEGALQGIGEALRDLAGK